MSGRHSSNTDKMSWGSGGWDSQGWWKEEYCPPGDRHLPFSSPPGRYESKARDRSQDRERSPRRASSSYQGALERSPGVLERSGSRRHVDRKHPDQKFHSEDPLSILHNQILDKRPRDFHASPTHLDTRKMKDLDLPRVIQSSDWADNKNITGIEVEKVPLAALLFDGVGNWVARHLAHGRSTYIVMTRRYPESRFLHDISTAAFKRNVDFEVLVRAWATQNNVPTGSNEELWKAFEQYAGSVVDTLKNQHAKESDSKLFARIEQLERELAEAKTTTAPASRPAASGDKMAQFQCNDTKILGQIYPTTAKPKELRAFEKRLALNKAGLTKQKSLASTLQEAINDKMDEPAQKNWLQTLLVEWGLPVTMAGQYDVPAAVSVISFVVAKSQSK